VFVEDEHYLDMAAALSGTGAAYIFIFMEAVIDAAWESKSLPSALECGPRRGVRGEPAHTARNAFHHSGHFSVARGPS
jgi:hypothetical protein